MPFELRPFPHETLSPKGDYIQNAWQSSVWPMAERFNVKIVLPDVNPQPHTHLAHEGTLYAKEYGKGNEYTEAVLAAFFVDGRDIGDIDVLTEIAGKVGLDGAAFRKAFETRKYEQAHKEALRNAYDEARITAVPTFFIGDQRVQGLNTKEMLERYIERELGKEPPAAGEACGIDGC